MRIVHIKEYFYPQLGYQETFLAREQAKLGHDVYVVTSDRYGAFLYKSNQQLLGSRIMGAGLVVEEGIKTCRLSTLFEIPHCIWLRDLGKKVQELEPEIVIVHDIPNLSTIRIALMKKRGASFKLIYDVHSTFGNSTSKMRVIYPLYRQTFSRLIRQTADGLVAIGEPSRTFMHHKHGIPLDQIHVIPLGADHERFQFDPTARHEVRTKLSIHENDIVFIYTGKIVPKKKLSVLIQALGRLASANNDVKLILVGSGPQDYVSRLKDEANSLKLGDKLVWHDTVPNEELPRYYSAADVAVWPAWASISMLEAMSCGLPIIVSDSRNINEMTFVTSALTYSGYDPSNLAEQMQRLLDPIFRQRLGQEGRRIIDEKLNWKVIAKQFVDIAEGGML